MTIIGSGRFSLIEVKLFVANGIPRHRSTKNEWRISAIDRFLYPKHPCLYATIVSPKQHGRPQTESFDVTDLKPVG